MANTMICGTLFKIKYDLQNYFQNKHLLRDLYLKTLSSNHLPTKFYMISMYSNAKGNIKINVSDFHSFISTYPLNARLRCMTETYHQNHMKFCLQLVHMLDNIRKHGYWIQVAHFQIKVIGFAYSIHQEDPRHQPIIYQIYKRFEQLIYFLDIRYACTSHFSLYYLT